MHESLIRWWCWRCWWRLRNIHTNYDFPIVFGCTRAPASRAIASTNILHMAASTVVSHGVVKQQKNEKRKFDLSFDHLIDARNSNSSRNQHQWYFFNKRHYSVRSAVSVVYACAATFFILNIVNSVRTPCLFSAWLEPPTLIDRSTWKKKTIEQKFTQPVQSYETQCNECERRILGDEWLEYRSRFHAHFKIGMVEGLG